MKAATHCCWLQAGPNIFFMLKSSREPSWSFLWSFTVFTSQVLEVWAVCYVIFLSVRYGVVTVYADSSKTLAVSCAEWLTHQSNQKRDDPKHLLSQKLINSLCYVLLFLWFLRCMMFCSCMWLCASLTVKKEAVPLLSLSFFSSLTPNWG